MALAGLPLNFPPGRLANRELGDFRPYAVYGLHDIMLVGKAECSWVKSRSPSGVTKVSPMPDSFSDALKGRHYCLFTTLKRNGDAVSCPMWFALDGETLYMRTLDPTPKVARARNNPNVTVAWCDSMGKRQGKKMPGTATLVESEQEREKARELLNQRYGLRKKLIDFGLRFTRNKKEVFLKVVPREE